MNKKLDIRKNANVLFAINVIPVAFIASTLTSLLASKVPYFTVILAVPSFTPVKKRPPVRMIKKEKPQTEMKPKKITKKPQKPLKMNEPKAK